MALGYLGSLTVGAINPGLQTALGSALPRLQAELAVANTQVAQLNAHPPTIVASLATANALVATIEQAIAVGVQVPSLSLQLAAATSLIAAVNVEIEALGFDLGAAGIHAYTYTGTASGLGPALPTSFPGGGPADPCNALVLATSIPASWAALAQVLKTS